MWNLWGIPFIKLGKFSLLGSHTPWQSLASKRCHKRLICCISVGVLMMLNQVSIVVVRQDGLMQLLHKLLFDPIQLFFMRLLFWCLARLVTSQLVHHAHYFWPQAAISEVSVEIGLWASVSIVNLTPCIKVIFPTSVKPDFIFPLSKQLLILKWARQVSSCSHTVSMASSDFHWGNPPRPCAKMFWLMSWNSGWAFLGHRFNKVHNVIWGQSCKLPASNHANPQKTEDFKGPVCAMRSNLNISNFDLQMPNKSQKAITVFALSDTKDKPTLAANHDGTWMQWVRWCQERN